MQYSGAYYQQNSQTSSAFRRERPYNALGHVHEPWEWVENKTLCPFDRVQAHLSLLWWGSSFLDTRFWKPFAV